MKMKMVHVMAAALVVSYSAVAAADGAQAEQGQSVASQGGLVVLWPQNAGRFMFVNAQRRVPSAALSTTARRLCDEFNVDVRLAEGSAPDVRTARGEMAKLGAKGAIWVVDDPALPMVLAAAEDGWGILNVAPLLDGAPSDKAAGVRVARVANRLFGMLNGCFGTMMIPQCVMRPVHSVAEIDALFTSDFSPEAYTKIASFMKEAGYLNARRNTYLGACREGWAPAPTNAVQRALWEQAQADKERGPANAIKIPPPKKAGNR